MTEKTELQQQAEEILDWSRRKLTSKLPEFFPAIYLRVPKESETANHLWTDGETLYYHPETVVRDYVARKDDIAAQILHIVIHGLMGHFTKRRGHNEAIFDAAADLKACDFMDRLDVPLSKRWKVAEAKKLRAFEKISLEVACQLPATEQQAAEMIESAAPFHMDDHRAWTKNSGHGGAKALRGELEKMWNDVAVQVAQRMGGRTDKRYGHLSGKLSEYYCVAQESSVSYTEMLRRFCVKRERQEIDPDSINAIWYHVGMELMGDAPIVEPEEVREDAPALELAVALDTSGSCEGEIMRGFLSELLAILRDAGGPRMEFTLIQCDAKIQSVQTLTREDTVEQVMRGMTISGFGGTDFRPVFEYIEKERAAADGKRFRGLLYLSDGCGSFPRQKPDYPVVFLFPEEEGCGWGFGSGSVPAWVTRAYITEEQRLVIHEGNN